MGLLDRFKRTAKTVQDKAADVADDHGDKVKGGIDKAADFVDDKTGHKHDEKIDQAADKAKDMVDKLGDQGDEAG